MLDGPARGPTLARMDEFASALGLAGNNSLVGFLAALGIWAGVIAMIVVNVTRAKDAAEDRKAMQAQAAQDRKVTQGMLAALQELIRRTSPPRPDPAE